MRLPSDSNERASGHEPDVLPITPDRPSYLFNPIYIIQSLFYRMINIVSRNHSEPG